MGRGRGRPEKVIDKEQFERLCEIQCSEESISKVLGISKRTLYSWCKKTYGTTFAETFSEKREAGLCRLRNVQYEIAVQDRNPTMCMFLGKNWLGQCDKPSPNNAEPEPEIDDEIEAILAEFDEE